MKLNLITENICRSFTIKKFVINIGLAVQALVSKCMLHLLHPLKERDTKRFI